MPQRRSALAEINTKLASCASDSPYYLSVMTMTDVHDGFSLGPACRRA
jgi:hypothetical protein